MAVVWEVVGEYALLKLKKQNGETPKVFCVLNQSENEKHSKNFQILWIYCVVIGTSSNWLYV